MEKALKNIIGEVINMKCGEVYELNFKDMTESEKTRFDKIKTVELEKKLNETLSDEQRKLFNEFIEEETELDSIVQGYMFRSGVRMGLNDLSFIGTELGLEANII